MHLLVDSRAKVSDGGVKVVLHAIQDILGGHLLDSLLVVVKVRDDLVKGLLVVPVIQSLHVQRTRALSQRRSPIIQALAASTCS